MHRRILRELPGPGYDGSASLVTRLSEALREASETFANEPALLEAILAAMVAPDPEVQRIRTSIGIDVARRIQVAVGPDVDPRILDGALLLPGWPMLQAGLGYFTFDEVVARIGAVADLWDGN